MKISKFFDVVCSGLMVIAIIYTLYVIIKAVGGLL